MAMRSSRSGRSRGTIWVTRRIRASVVGPLRILAAREPGVADLGEGVSLRVDVDGAQHVHRPDGGESGAQQHAEVAVYHFQPAGGHDRPADQQRRGGRVAADHLAQRPGQTQP
jgi:hypothetical protein